MHHSPWFLKLHFSLVRTDSYLNISYCGLAHTIHYKFSCALLVYAQKLWSVRYTIDECRCISIQADVSCQYIYIYRYIHISYVLNTIFCQSLHCTHLYFGEVWLHTKWSFLEELCKYTLEIHIIVIRNFTHTIGNYISVVSSYMELTLVFYRLTITL